MCVSSLCLRYYLCVFSPFFTLFFCVFFPLCLRTLFFCVYSPLFALFFVCVFPFVCPVFCVFLPPVVNNASSSSPFLALFHAHLYREERPDGDKDGAPASSGVEVVSSEHYAVPDSGVDESVTAGQSSGELGAGSTPTAPGGDGSAAGGGGDGVGKGTGDATEFVGDDGERGAGSVLGVEGPEIMIRAPTYGFNDKVGFGAVLYASLPSRCMAGRAVSWLDLATS